MTSTQLRAAEALLSAYRGKNSRIDEVHVVREPSRHVFRIEAGGETWIVKAREKPMAADATVWPFLVELVASQFAAEVAPEIAPAFVGASRDELIIVLE